MGDEVFYSNFRDAEELEVIRFGQKVLEEEKATPFFHMMKVRAILKNGDIVTDSHVFDKYGESKSDIGWITPTTDKQLAILGAQVRLEELIGNVNFTKVAPEICEEINDLLEEANEIYKQKVHDEYDEEDCNDCEHSNKCDNAAKAVAEDNSDDDDNDAPRGSIIGILLGLGRR